MPLVLAFAGKSSLDPESGFDTKQWHENDTIYNVQFTFHESASFLNWYCSNSALQECSIVSKTVCWFKCFFECYLECFLKCYLKWFKVDSFSFDFQFSLSRFRNDLVPDVYIDIWPGWFLKLSSQAANFSLLNVASCSRRSSGRH